MDRDDHRRPHAFRADSDDDSWVLKAGCGGLSPRFARELADGGEIVPLLDDIYVSAASPRTAAIRAHALAALGSEQLPETFVFGGASAVFIHSAVRLDAPDLILVPSRSKRIGPFTQRQVAVLPDDLEQRGGYDVTSPSRTMFEFLSRGDETTSRAAFIALLTTGHVNYPGLRRMIAAHGRKRGTGIARRRLDALAIECFTPVPGV